MVKDKAVYLKGLHTAEVGIATGLKTLLSKTKNLKSDGWEHTLKKAEGTIGKILAESQRNAIVQALSNKVSIITGGPGTGKTTLIRAVLEIAKEFRLKVLLGAPTGRAAKRMSEATGCEAQTLHRLLEFSPVERIFRKDELNPLDADLIIVDETSMVDTFLMYRLLKAIPKGASLLLMGDADQLSSIGPGSVLRDIIDSGVVPTKKLHVVFRQGQESSIILNAHRINGGQMPFCSAADRPNDFRLVEVDDNERILERIIRLCEEEIPSEFGVDRLDDIQVLTPMHRGVAGTHNLNAELQKRLNRSKDGLPIGEITLKPGDKVMQTVNNYDKNVFNGDIGRILSIDKEAHEVTIVYGGRIVAYEYKEIDEISLAYAISVHKSQGSEYPVMIMPLSMQHCRLLQRCLLYTAVTRAKKLVILVGSKRALRMAVRNNTSKRRLTNLSHRLRQI